MVITMRKYITKEEFESAMQDITKSMFGLDVAIEVIVNECIDNSRKFEKLCIETAKKRVKSQNNSNGKQVNEIENYSKKEE